MKVAVYQGPPGSWPGKPISIEDRPVPTLQPKDVLVKIAACGMCHTDLTYLHGSPTPKAPPIILGHEPAGIIEEVGSQVTNRKVGEKVLVSSLFPCLECTPCRQGHENLCSNLVLPGATRDGAFAEYIVCPASGAFPVPDTIPLEKSSIIADAVCTAYHAVAQVADVRAGDTVAIFGASGGVGLCCVQFASFLGARVIGIGRKKKKLALAEQFGANTTVCLDEVDRIEKVIRQMSSGGADICIEATGVPSMVESACKSCKAGGKIVEVGFSFEEIRLEINRLLWMELNIIGSKNFNPVDIPKVFKLIEKGAINLDKMVSHQFKLDQINEAYQTLERGEMIRGIIVP